MTASGSDSVAGSSVRGLWTHAGRRRAEHPWRFVSAAVLGLVLLAALLVFFRGRPTVESDAGIFLSVGGRLLEGDRLYEDVFDNKDPLVYYLYAAALASGDWRVPFLLDIAWVALAGISTALLTLRIGCRRPTVVAAAIAYPLLLTGPYYYAGYTMLPALALAPLIAFWATWRPHWAGILLGLALMLKINLALVLVAPVLALWLTADVRRSIAGVAARAVVGAVATISCVGIVLALRGELRAYLTTLVDNVEYANAVFPATGRRGGLLGHVSTVYHGLDHRWIAVSLFALGGASAATQLARSRRSANRFSAPERLAVLFLATSGAVAVTLAATAIWQEHLQMLALPATFLVAYATERLAGGPTKAVGAGAAALVVSLGLGAFSEAPDQDAPLRQWLVRSPSATADLLEQARMLHVAQPESVTYFHLGSNDEQGHAAFLDAEFTLACPRFHQYEFSNLEHVLDCLFKAEPDMVFVTPSFRARGDARVAWNQFVNEGRDLVSARYRRVVASRDADIWVRQNLIDPRSHLGTAERPHRDSGE